MPCFNPPHDQFFNLVLHCFYSCSLYFSHPGLSYSSVHQVLSYFATSVLCLEHSPLPTLHLAGWIYLLDSIYMLFFRNTSINYHVIFLSWQPLLSLKDLRNFRAKVIRVRCNVGSLISLLIPGYPYPFASPFPWWDTSRWCAHCSYCVKLCTKIASWTCLILFENGLSLDTKSILLPNVSSLVIPSECSKQMLSGIQHKTAYLFLSGLR